MKQEVLGLQAARQERSAGAWEDCWQRRAGRPEAASGSLPGPSSQLPPPRQGTFTDSVTEVVETSRQHRQDPSPVPALPTIRPLLTDGHAALPPSPRPASLRHFNKQKQSLARFASQPCSQPELPVDKAREAPEALGGQGPGRLPSSPTGNVCIQRRRLEVSFMGIRDGAKGLMRARCGA